MTGQPVSDSTAIDTIAAALLHARSWDRMAAVLGGLTRPAPSKVLNEALEAYIPILQRHLERGRPHEAMSSALAMMFVDSDQAIGLLRRHGRLRASKYGFNATLIANIARAAIKLQPIFRARPDRLAYLNSLIAMSKLAPNVRSLHHEMVQILRTRKDVVIKTILVVINSRYYHRWLNDPTKGSLDTDHYSSEDLSDAVSLIIATYNGLFTLTDNCCNHVDQKAIAADMAVYERLFLAAVRIVKFKEAETLIDGLPYEARLDGETVRIFSSDPDIEKSIRLGYIQSINQTMMRARRLDDQKAPPRLSELIEEGFAQDLFSPFIESVETPVRRIRLRFPEMPQLFGLFEPETVYREEMESLLILDVDHFAEPAELLFPLSDGVTSGDIFRLQRYFNFISCLFQKEIEKVEDEAERMRLTYTSTVVIVSHDSLIRHLNLVFQDEAKARQIIAMLTMDLSKDHLDIQYTPFIDLGSYYAIAPHVVAASNLVRNMIVANRLRKGTLGRIDKMHAAVCGALDAAGFKVRGDFKIRAGGKDMELDIVAWRDDTLFLFECKNAYHPCSTHEMRNSFDHVKVGRDQLNVRASIFGQPAHQKQLFAKLGWNVKPTSHIHTGIIIANRVFHGANLEGHPVRQAHEFINVVSAGILVGGEEPLSLWAGAAFQTSDLCTYLGQNSVVAKQLTALDPHISETRLGYRRLEYVTCILDPQKLADVMLASYGPVQKDVADNKAASSAIAGPS
ncbi:hypothetical protein [Sphingobium vermicomposti]|nr:hypothetical protein [Sphingobium vermicomposti]